jgi:Flp pilus assembly protein TadD
MSNWFSNLFGGKPVTEAAREVEPKDRVVELIKEATSAVKRGDAGTQLRCGEEILKIDPKEEMGWAIKIAALQDLGRRAEAAEANRQAKDLGVKLFSE